MRGLLLVSLLLPAVADGADVDAIAIHRERQALRTDGLWPGFDPSAVPIAIYDGEATYLFDHPSPPEEFAPVAGQPGVRRFDGLHEDLRANTSILLGGVRTATVKFDGRGRTARRILAGVTIHEAFHAFTRVVHPDWGADESGLFLYPVEKADVLSLRRLETEALRRALDADDDEESRGWARTALELRERRMVLLPTGAGAYERSVERFEGCAQFVENAATGGPHRVRKGGYAASEVRDRCYDVGEAWARLLGRHAPEWRERAGTMGRPFVLDSLLAGALGAGGSRSFRDDEVRQANEVARADARKHREAIRSMKREFLNRSGMRLVVESGSPLWPQGFDPLNLERLSSDELLHTRWLKLGNDAGQIEILDRSALTHAAGAHPLFNGVDRVTVAGLPATLDLSTFEGAVKLDLEGLTIDLKGAAVVRSEGSILIRLP